MENMFSENMNQISLATNHLDSYEFTVAVNNFEVFLEQQYLHRSEQKSVQELLNDIFNEIVVIKNPLAAVIIVKLLTKVKFDDKVQKAIKISHHISGIGFDQNPIYWLYLADVLEYLCRIIPKSMFQIFSTLYSNISKESNSQKIAELSLLFVSMMYSRFDEFVDKILTEETVLEIFKTGLQMNDVLNTTLYSLKRAVEPKKKEKIKNKFPLEKFSEILMKNALSGKPELIDSASDTISLLINIIPQSKRLFKFGSVPLHLLQSKETSLRLAGFKIILVCYECDPGLFDDDINRTIFKTYEMLIKKKTQNRNEALMGFGSYIFARKGNFNDEELGEIFKCQKIVEESIDSDQAGYCYLALITNKSDTFENNIQLIYHLPLSLTLVDAFYKSSQIVPENKELLYNRIISMANIVLLDTKYQTSSILNAFECLNKMEIPYNYFSLELILQYSLHMTNNVFKIRKLASNIVLKYQEKNPTVDVVQRVLAVIATENNEKHRNFLMNNLNRQPLNRNILPSLQLLLHDLKPEIRSSALDYIATLTHFEEASQLLKDFLSEKIHDLENSNIIYKEHIKCFLIIASAAFSDPNAVYAPYSKQLLVPFAQFLITHLLSSTQFLSTSSIKLLYQIIPLSPESVDTNVLAYHVSNYLLVHSSNKRIAATLNLLKVALSLTDLKFTIYSEHSDIIVKLINLCNSQSAESIESRIQYLKIISSIGAISPSKMSQLQVKTQSLYEKASLESPNLYLAKYTADAAVEGLTMASVAVVLLKILDILSEESLSALHSNAIEVLINTLKTHRHIISDELESQVMNRITQLMSNSGTSTISILIKSISTFILILGDKFAPLVPSVVDLICNNWTKMDHGLFLRISNWLMYYLPDAYIPHLPRITSVFIENIDNYDVKTVNDILLSVLNFGVAVKSIDHILYPPLLNYITFHANENLDDILYTFMDILINGGAQKFSSQLLQTMFQIVEVNPNLQRSTLNVIYVVAVHLGSKFLLFVPHLLSIYNLTMITEEVSELANKKLDDQPHLRNIYNLNAYILCLETGGTPSPNIIDPCYPKENTKSQATEKNKNQFKQTDKKFDDFSVPEVDFDEGQWLKWANEFFGMIVKNSDIRAIASCENIIDKHSGLADALYPIALALFYYQYKSNGIEKVEKIFKVIFKSNHVPRNVVRHFLGSLEFMEVLGTKIPISLPVVCEKAQAADRIAQSLRYSEILFDECDNSQTERLITINQQLGLPLAARAVLFIANERGFTKQTVLAEKLGLWEEALKLYNKEEEKDPKNQQGQLKCIYELSQYTTLKEYATKYNDPLYLASAEWKLFEKEHFLETISKLNDNTSNESLYYRSIYHVIKGEYDKAEDLIDQMRLQLADEIFPTIAEDYERVYRQFSRVSFSTEIKEVILFLKNKKEFEEATNKSEKLRAQKVIDRIIKTWKIRFNELPDDPNILHELLCIRSLALPPEKLDYLWIKFLDTSICNEKNELVEHSLNYLQNELHSTINTQVIKCKLYWSKGEKEKAIQELPVNESGSYLLLGKWYMEIGKLNESKENLSKVIREQSATSTDWSLWANVNLKLYQETKEKSYLTNSLEGLIVGISLNPSDPLSFSLKIISILFKQGNTQLYQMFYQHMDSTPISIWLQVLPQIIARAGSDDHDLRKFIKKLIYYVGSQQPHVVLYSLMVPLKSDKSLRQKIASSIFDKLKILYPNVVEQMLTLANELIRTAVSWWEMWNSALDEASRAYITRKNNEEMIDLLLPCHELISRKPETFYEIMFIRQFGFSLKMAEKWIRRYRVTKEDECLFQAWQLYIGVFHQLKPIINELTSISLPDASPLLCSLNNSELIVPGSFSYNNPLVGLMNVESKMTIMKSKQRPRRMALFGTDGVKYTFLLKANEDTRLDERVMQFFTFVNALVSHSTMPLKDKLTITTYNVIPITAEVGLIGWVPECNTIYELVKNYREKHGVPLEIEYQSTIKICPNYESLPADNPNKVTSFRKGLKAQTGNDLKHMILTYADDSNHWIERRTLYTTSLSMTSMAGYILGLGDRHLSNIMIKKRSAKLVHIDFGDCFEVAMHREKFPEVVPFRLTRILQNALEVSRIEGTFRKCCQNVMKLFRDNGDQIMGLLEVFIYDPLRQWIDEKDTNSNTQEISSAIGIMKRIEDKLTGRDIIPDTILSVNDQVDKLITQASDVKNLCVMYRGWFPWW